MLPIWPAFFTTTRSESELSKRTMLGAEGGNGLSR